MSLLDLAELEAWIGRSETALDTVTATPAAGLAATLDRAVPVTGAALPPLWHWIYFTPQAAQADLGADGHPRLGGFMPPIPLPRRMWAGGRLVFHDPLRIGDAMERRTEIAGLQTKNGSQGPLVFVTLRHAIHTARGLAIEEEQDLVYRPAEGVGRAGRGAPGTPLPAQWREAVEPDPRLLFRYSALTFNAHRIHYDLPYAQEAEGYPGLVVQGPLTATLLADRLLAHGPGRLARFAFRGRSPLFAGRTMQVCGMKAEEAGAFALWAEDDTGAVAMTAEAVMETIDAY